MAAPSRAETTRARLLEAAVAAFSEKGFHGTTTRTGANSPGSLRGMRKHTIDMPAT